MPKRLSATTIATGCTHQLSRRAVVPRRGGGEATVVIRPGFPEESWEGPRGSVDWQRSPIIGESAVDRRHHGFREALGRLGCGPGWSANSTSSWWAPDRRERLPPAGSLRAAESELRSS